MSGSAEYECGECRHRFRVPEGAVRDSRLLMCPSCGSIDLNLTTARRTPVAVWKSSETIPAPGRSEERDKVAP
jgi:DNA-directed RNA polymerase subunit RPC12/RpoP